MKQTSIRQLLIGSFAVVLAAMLAMGIIAYPRIGEIKQHARLVETNTTADLHSAAELAIAWGQRYSLLQPHILLESRNSLRSVEERLQAGLLGWVEYNRAQANAATHLITELGSSAQIGMAVSLAVAVLLAIGRGTFLLRAITVPLGR